MSADEWGEVELEVPPIPVDVADSTVSTAEKDDPAWWAVFLDLFSKGASVTLAARGAGVDRTTPYLARRTSERFAAMWTAAEEASTQALEDVARQRAVKQSDVLLIFLLKARRPEVYRENHKVELTGASGGPIQTQVVPEGLSDHERAALRQAIDAELARRGAEVEG